jgi:4-hydroxybenzoate polyprenyltransferase
MSSQIKVQLSLPQDNVSLREKIKGFWQMMRADKPFGIFLLLWPALWALWIAGKGNPNWYVTLVFILGLLLIRSAGCAVTEYADRRSASRAMPACRQPVAMGIVKPVEAIVLMSVLFMTVLFLLFTLNLNTVLMSVIALFMAIAYAYSRRFTYFSQIVSAAIFAWIVPLSFTAIENSPTAVSWLLYLTAFVWVLIYELEHSFSQRHTDMINGTKTLAIYLGDKTILLLAVLQLILMVSLVGMGIMTGRSWIYFTAITLSSLFLLRQQQLMRRDKINGSYAAYLNNNCFAMVIFLVILLDYAISG